jgi:hypothetical protein
MSDQTKDIEKALSILLTRLIAHRKYCERQPQPPGRLELIEFDDIKVISPNDSAIDRIIEDPIEGAYLLAIRKLGERLFRLGGIDLMQDVAERVSVRSRRHPNYRGSIIDHHWDGVGDARIGQMWVA